MNFKLLMVMLLFVVITGCSTTIPVNATLLPVTVTVSLQDLKIGEKITHSIPYDKDDPNIYAKVYKEALEKSGHDFILLPQYEVKESLFKGTITITGYGASIRR